MMPTGPTAYLLLADAVLVLHFLFIAFVLAGLALILVGHWRGWGWIRDPWFRWLHLAAIGIVVLQAVLQVPCPLTVWEGELRRLGGGGAYEAGFIETWVHWLIFYDAATRVFNLAYLGFGLLVLLTFLLIPPRGRGAG